MTTASHVARIEATTIVGGLRMPLQFAAGFFFAFRICIVYLAFQSNPTLGGEVILALNGVLLVAGMLYALGDSEFSFALLFRSPVLRWLGVYLALSGASLLWTEAESTLIATVYWIGMVIEVATVPLLAKGRDLVQQTDMMLKGFVVGTCMVAAIAWLSPTLPDMRIGHEEYLVSNLVGLFCALGFFLAQHLASKDRVWRWCCIGLALALLRTISKTSIIAFFIAETFYLLREQQISKATKLKIAAGAVAAVAAFWGIFSSYLTIYESGATTGPETLTGRTVVWGIAFPMALEHPLIGHGLYSFRTLMPPVGIFQPWHAHNVLLQQFFEFGLAGVVATIAVHLALFRAGLRNRQRAYGKLAWVLVIFCVIHGFADAAAFGFSLPLWLFAALAIPLAQQTQDRAEVSLS